MSLTEQKMPEVHDKHKPNGYGFTDLYFREEFPYDTFEYTHPMFQLVRLSLSRQSEDPLFDCEKFSSHRHH